ncbi:homeobox protein onecut isoform X1 [Drosophila serrata]|uniref:homeobox protein onecut isoform X1 n=1 Tax=Drosophila serrata TaxID=7274 RepID=UPI000A1D0623|nr:homeobox protein onecut isoform X1 [Drosophila serrata]XP_020809929.1 homeobox protein onecut isoform X1 [Drosophila serrata]XP_020809930.1 homeobox protein onecut isoform X1 [Drosophila serrata]
MDSISQIIDPQPTFSQDLVEDATEFITEHQSQTHQEGEGPGPGSDLDADEVLSMQTIISDKKHRSGPDSGAVVMVIDEMDRQTTTTYQIVPHQQLQQLQQPRTMSFGMIQQDQHHNQRMIDSSPVESFVASDLSLDGLTVDGMSQATILPQELTTVKPETMSKLLIVQTKSGLDRANNKRIRMHVDVSSVSVGLGADVDDLDEISSDGDNCDDEGVTLNQHHHQQLLDEHQQVYSLASHHHHQHHQHQHHLHAHGHGQAMLGLQHNRSGQLDIGHSMAGGVIVNSQDREKDVDEEDDNVNGDGNDEDEDDDEIRDRGQLISQSSYQTLTSVNDRLSPPGFSPTSYATLTPIQPLPPISTMSEKFAYSGHISGSGDSGDTADVNGAEGDRVVVEATTSASSETVVGGGNGSGNGNGTSSECNSYSSALPMTISGGHHHLGLGVSPYSSYEKLTSMISPPPNNYLVSCDLHAATVVTSSGRMPNPSHLEELSHNGNKKDSAIQENTEDHMGGGSGGEKFTYSGHISGGGDSGDTDNHGEKFSYSDHISGGDSGDTDVHGEKFSYSDHISGGNNVTDVNGGTTWLQIASERESRLHLPSEHSLDDRFHLVTERKTRLNMTAQERTTSTRLQMQRHLHHQMAAETVPSICTTDWKSDEDWKHGSNTILPVVVSLTPTPPPPSITNVDTASAVGLKLSGGMSPEQQRSQQYFLNKSQQQEIDGAKDHVTPEPSVCSIQQSSLLNGFQNIQQQCAKIAISVSPKNGGGGGGSSSRTSGNSTDMEEINTKDLAQRISAELKRYSIPQAIFAQRVLCRSQGTLSDLLRNPKPWSKLKSGRETFRRMYKWLQEPEFQRMSALRMAAAQIPQRVTHLGSGNTATGILGSAGTGTGTNDNRDVMTTDADTHGGSSTMSPRATPIEPVSTVGPAVGPNLSITSNVVVNCRRKEEPQIEQMPQPKKPRLVFTDLQRRTLQAIFKETKRPSKEMQVTIARQLGLEPTTVGNFFMNARRRSMDKWRDDDSKNNTNIQHVMQSRPQQPQDEQDEDHSQIPNQNHNTSQSISHDNYSTLHTTAMSPLGAFDEDADMDLELEGHDFDLVDPDQQGDNNTDRHGDML